jgi:hypothetical protein
MQILKKENKRLQNELTQATHKNQELHKKLDQCQKLNEILSKEKEFGSQELSSLRVKFRIFLRELLVKIDTLSNEKALMDYAGGELIKRSKVYSKSSTVIYLGKNFKNGDEIRGIAGYFAGPTVFKIKIFRKMEDDSYLCVGESKELTAKEGPNYLMLENKIVLDDNDIIGITFLEKANFYYDQKDGGFYTKDNIINIGEKIKLEKSTYSISLRFLGYFDELPNNNEPKDKKPVS